MKMGDIFVGKGGYEDIFYSYLSFSLLITKYITLFLTFRYICIENSEMASHATRLLPRKQGSGKDQTHFGVYFRH